MGASDSTRLDDAGRAGLLHYERLFGKPPKLQGPQPSGVAALTQLHDPSKFTMRDCKGRAILDASAISVEEAFKHFRTHTAHDEITAGLLTVAWALVRRL
jgi:hypothetical protein